VTKILRWRKIPDTPHLYRALQQDRSLWLAGALPVWIDWWDPGICHRLALDLQSRTPEHGPRRYHPEAKIGPRGL